MTNHKPIPSVFIKKYVDNLLTKAEMLPAGPLKHDCITEVRALIDMVHAWRNSKS